MVMKKLLVFSLVIGFLLMSGVITNTENPLTAGMGAATAGMTLGSGDSVASFSFGTVVVYFIAVGAIYLFGRSVVKSFGG